MKRALVILAASLILSGCGEGRFVISRAGANDVTIMLDTKTGDSWALAVNGDRIAWRKMSRN